MYLLVQMTMFLLAAFLLGIAVGYALWKSMGEREMLAKFSAAEMRLAQHLASFQRAQHPVQYQPPMSMPPPNEPPPFAAAHTNASEEQARLEARLEEAARRELHDFEVKQAALMREAGDAAIRNAEAAAEKKLADLAGRLGYDLKSQEARAQRGEAGGRREPHIALVDTTTGNAAADLHKED